MYWNHPISLGTFVCSKQETRNPDIKERKEMLLKQGLGVSAVPVSVYAIVRFHLDAGSFG